MERMNRRIERNKNRNHNGNQNEKRHRKRSRGNMKAENARISAVRLYLHYISIHIRSAMQYKTSFFLTTLGQFLFSFNVFMGITFMFQRFHEVKGFTYSEVLICYALVLVEFSLAEMFARGFDSFSGMVRHAEFDRVLVRPRNEILQVLGSKFELSRIGRSFQAIILFIYGVMTVQIDWNLTRVLTVLFMLIGGAPLGFFYKAVNTMDSMVGYKNEKYLHFGRFAAKMDDVWNYIPSRISALLMIASAWIFRMDYKRAWAVWKRDRRKHASPNSAQTEAVCAGALQVQLAGDAYYFGKLYPKETIGDDVRPIEPEDILRAGNLMDGTALLTLLVFGLLKYCMILM